MNQPKITFEEELTWTCHICGERRPDALIGVVTTVWEHPAEHIPVTQHVRYCTDRPACVAAAPSVRWFPDLVPLEGA